MVNTHSALNQQSNWEDGGELGPSRTRRRRADRSDLYTQTNIRSGSVRTSSMPGSPRRRRVRSRVTIDEAFNESYAKQGLQPTSYTNDQTGKPSQNNQHIRSTQVTYEHPQVSTTSVNDQQKKKRGVLKKRKGKSGIALKIRVIIINLGILTWGLFTWLVFQLPFAIMNNVFFSILVALDTLTIIDEDDGSLVKLGKTVVGAVTEGVKATAAWLQKTLDVDISVLSPGNFYIMTQAILLGYAIYILLIIYIIYKLSFLNPVFGKGESLKLGALLMTFIGYTIPVFNLFPWFLLWTAAVWKYPK